MTPLISLPISLKRLGFPYVCLRDTFRRFRENLEKPRGVKLTPLGISRVKVSWCFDIYSTKNTENSHEVPDRGIGLYQDDVITPRDK